MSSGRGDRWWPRAPLSWLPCCRRMRITKFMHVLGIHGDPVSARLRIDAAKRSGENLEPNPYGYRRAFGVVMDPPYYDNVMYAELSDFFYVWLKRTAGHIFPELFRRNLTDKENEAVANAARFKGEKGAKTLAGRDCQERMAAIFAECRRVPRPNGIMTLMFTHKATGAWDALAKGLMEARFAITASWPINTEAEGSLHNRKSALRTNRRDRHLSRAAGTHRII